MYVHVCMCMCMYVFLETTFEIRENGELKYWLKNDNAKERKIWRYQHWRSHAPFAQKKALVITCLRKVHKMASDRRRRYLSAIDKVREFIALDYPSTCSDPVAIS